MKAFIKAIDYSLPVKAVSNEELATTYQGWTADKIYSKTGIRTRYEAGPSQCASDLAEDAARKVFEHRGCSSAEIDYLIYCSQSPDYILPTTACTLQHRLGLKTDCGAVDINLGCSGFVYGLGLAKALIETGQAHKVLLLTADTYSKFIHPLDKSVRTLFSDAAAGTLISSAESDSAPLGPFVYGTDGRGADNLIVRTGGSRNRYVVDASIETDESGNSRTVNNLYMNGSEIFNFSLRTVPAAFASLLERTGLSADSVDLFVFHQANRFMLDHLQKKLKIPPEKFFVSLDDVGNTVSCSIPIALKRALDGDRIKSGDRVMLLGFGVGYSWAGTMVKWQ